MGKVAEHLFRLYLVTIALNAGNFKQLLARKVHKYGGLLMNFRVIPGLLDESKWKSLNLSCACYSIEEKITMKLVIEESDEYYVENFAKCQINLVK